MDEKPPFTVQVKDLNPGDTICLQFSEHDYDIATVYQKLENGNVKVWRPYVHTGDVLYSHGRVIPYIGVEDFELMAETTTLLLRRGPKLK